MDTAGMSVWVPVIAALLGALVGSVAPIVSSVIQSRAEHRRERLRLAVELAIADHEGHIEIAKTAQLPVVLAPLAISVLYHSELLDALKDGKKLSAEEFVAIGTRVQAIGEAVP